MVTFEDYIYSPTTEGNVHSYMIQLYKNGTGNDLYQAKLCATQVMLNPTYLSNIRPWILPCSKMGLEMVLTHISAGTSITTTKQGSHMYKVTDK